MTEKQKREREQEGWKEREERVCAEKGGGEQRIEMGVVLKFDMMLTKLA